MRYQGSFILAVLFLMVVTLESAGQKKAEDAILPVNLLWSEGSIMTNDGKELVGLLRYNDKNGLLSYENGDRSNTFTARAVVGFEFFDEQMKKQRVFYSFPYEDAQGVKRPLFFEVVMEFRDFAVLSKVDPIDVDYKSVGSSGGYDSRTNVFTPRGNYGTTVEISQVETIYLMDTQSNIKPYVRITEREIDGVFYDRTKTKNKMLDSDLLKELVGEAMSDKLYAYAKQHDLSFREKSDLIKIFQYYSELVKQ